MRSLSLRTAPTWTVRAVARCGLPTSRGPELEPSPAYPTAWTPTRRLRSPCIAGTPARLRTCGTCLTATGEGRPADGAALSAAPSLAGAGLAAARLEGQASRLLEWALYAGAAGTATPCRGTRGYPSGAPRRRALVRCATSVRQPGGRRLARWR